MKLKALAAAAAIALSGPALATPSSTTFNNLALGSVTYFGGFLGGSKETDFFSFNLAPGLSAAATLTVSNLSWGPVNDIKRFGAIFQDESLDLETKHVGFFLPLTISSFTGDGAAASSFSLAISGKGPAFYTGSFVVSSVPEPGTVAMMLAGMGVVGFVAARRRKAG